MLGHGSTRCRSAACGTASGRSPTASRSARTGPLGARRARRHAPPGRGPRPDPRVLLILGIPFLRLVQGVPGAEIYPPGVESRDAYVALQTEFAPGETTPIVILADVSGSPTSLANIRALDAYAARVDALEGIDRVESPFVIHDPATGALLAPEQVAAALRAARRPAPAGLDELLAPYVRGSTVRLDAISPLPPSRPRRPPHPPDPRASTRAPGSPTAGRRQRRPRPRLPGRPGRARPVRGRPDPVRQRRDPVPAVRVGRPAAQGRAHDPALDHGQLRRDGLDLPGGPPVRAAQLHAARLHHRGQPDHHVQRHLRAVDGLRGPAPVADPGGLPADRRQHRLGRRGPGEDGRGHHRRGPDHGLGLRGVRPGRRDHDQEHRRRDGDRGRSSTRRSSGSCSSRPRCG